MGLPHAPQILVSDMLEPGGSPGTSDKRDWAISLNQKRHGNSIGRPLEVIESAHKAPWPPMGHSGGGRAQCDFIGYVWVTQRF